MFTHLIFSNLKFSLNISKDAKLKSLRYLVVLLPFHNLSYSFIIELLHSATVIIQFKDINSIVNYHVSNENEFQKISEFQ